MTKQNDGTGVVNPYQLYSLEALKKCLGIRDATIRAARRAGLPVYYKHGRGFVHGRDWIAYVCSPSQPAHCDFDEAGTQTQFPSSGQIPE